MAGFVKEVTPRVEALELTARELLFPWSVKNEEMPLSSAIGRRLARDVLADGPYPPYTRSLRDGWAQCRVWMLRPLQAERQLSCES